MKPTGKVGLAQLERRVTRLEAQVDRLEGENDVLLRRLDLTEESLRMALGGDAQPCWGDQYSGAWLGLSRDGYVAAGGERL